MERYAVKNARVAVPLRRVNIPDRTTDALRSDRHHPTPSDRAEPTRATTSSRELLRRVGEDCRVLAHPRIPPATSRRTAAARVRVRDQNRRVGCVRRWLGWLVRGERLDFGRDRVHERRLRPVPPPRSTRLRLRAGNQCGVDRSTLIMPNSRNSWATWRRNSGSVRNRASTSARRSSEIRRLTTQLTDRPTVLVHYSTRCSRHARSSWFAR